MAGKFDPQLFFQQADNVALHVAASELFSLLSRSLDLPPKWAALVTRDTGDRVVVPAGGRVDGRGVEDVMFARVTPVEVVIEEDNVASRDGFNCRVEVHVRLSLIAERGELSSFQKAVLGSRRVVQAAGLAQYLQPTIRTALGKIAAGHDAASLVGAGTSEIVSSALAEAVKAPCFSAGLALDRDPTARFESGSYGKVRQAQERAATRRAEHEAAQQVQEALSRARADQLDDLATLLGRLNELAADSPDVDLPELLRTFSEHQRGELYQALFASEAPTARTRWIVVAAGNELLFFDAKDSSQPSRRLTIDGEAGPVRSIQAVTAEDGSGVLLLGAATGVYRLPIDRAEPDLTLLVADAPPVRGGFNAVESIGDRVFASHSELGLCEWEVDEPVSAKRRFESMTRGAKAVRNVAFLGGDLYCSIDDRVIRFSADDPGDRPKQVYTGGGSIITALCATTDGLFAGNSDGDVLHWPVGRDADPEVLHRGMKRAAESLRMLSSHGVKRLVFTDTSLQVHARVLGDNFTCQYEAGGQTLRRVEVAPDLLVATNDLRDRLICWACGKPKQPSAVIGVSRICSRSIQDVCLVGVS